MCWSLNAADHDAARVARKAATATLRALTPSPDALADAELIIGELLANAARHANGPVCLELSARSGAAEVSVHDTSPEFAVDVRRPVDDFSESGRGLLIISELARRITVVPLAGIGKCVTVTLDIPVPPTVRALEPPCERTWLRDQTGVCFRPRIATYHPESGL
jgi:anti-sigma regulatory factor (Ser/Thr protein kinase)